MSIEARPAAAIYICRTCKPEGFAGPAELRPGAIFARATVKRIAERELGRSLSCRAVDCLSVCKRPCTAAINGPGKFGYIVGDLLVEKHVDDIIDFAMSHGRSADGIPPWRERPEVVRKQTVARIPPFGATQVPVAEIDVEELVKEPAEVDV